ncbi:unnamed protein product, partial [Urochloa humidicola]
SQTQRCRCSQVIRPASRADGVLAIAFLQWKSPAVFITSSVQPSRSMRSTDDLSCHGRDRDLKNDKSKKFAM